MLRCGAYLFCPVTRSSLGRDVVDKIPNRQLPLSSLGVYRPGAGKKRLWYVYNRATGQQWAIWGLVWWFAGFCLRRHEPRPIRRREGNHHEQCLLLLFYSILHTALLLYTFTSVSPLASAASDKLTNQDAQNILYEIFESANGCSNRHPTTTTIFHQG